MNFSPDFIEKEFSNALKKGYTCSYAEAYKDGDENSHVTLPRGYELGRHVIAFQNEAIKKHKLKRWEIPPDLVKICLVEELEFQDKDELELFDRHFILPVGWVGKQIGYRKISWNAVRVEEYKNKKEKEKAPDRDRIQFSPEFIEKELDEAITQLGPDGFPHCMGGMAKAYANYAHITLPAPGSQREIGHIGEHVLAFQELVPYHKAPPGSVKICTLEEFKDKSRLRGVTHVVLPKEWTGKWVWLKKLDEEVDVIEDSKVQLQDVVDTYYHIEELLNERSDENTDLRCVLVDVKEYLSEYVERCWGQKLSSIPI